MGASGLVHGMGAHAGAGKQVESTVYLEPSQGGGVFLMSEVLL